MKVKKIEGGNALAHASLWTRLDQDGPSAKRQARPAPTRGAAHTNSAHTRFTLQLHYNPYSLIRNVNFRSEMVKFSDFSHFFAIFRKFFAIFAPPAANKSARRKMFRRGHTLLSPGKFSEWGG